MERRVAQTGDDLAQARVTARQQADTGALGCIFTRQRLAKAAGRTSNEDALHSN
jgi:hypothetical protein